MLDIRAAIDAKSVGASRARQVLLGLLCAACGLCSPLAAAQSFTITFDSGDPVGGLAVDSVLGSQYVASTGALFTPNAFTGPGGPVGNWATNTNLVVVDSAGTDIGALGTPALVSGKILRSFAAWLNEDGDPSILVDFTAALPASCSVTLAGISTFADCQLFAYDATGTVIDSDTATATGQQVLTVSAAGIARMAIVPGSFNDWVGVDNISCSGALLFADGFETPVGG